MRRIALWIITMAALGAAIIATSQAKPVISATRYMETIYHDCPQTTGVQDCNLSFTKIPAGKVLTIQNVNCSMSAVYNGAFLMTAYLKVSNAGTVGHPSRHPGGDRRQHPELSHLCDKPANFCFCRGGLGADRSNSVEPRCQRRHDLYDCRATRCSQLSRAARGGGGPQPTGHRIWKHSKLKRWHAEGSAGRNATVQRLGFMRLTIVGCGDAFGSGGRINTCFWLETAKATLLVDCGASASLAALKASGLDHEPCRRHRPVASARRSFRRPAVPAARRAIPRAARAHC